MSVGHPACLYLDQFGAWVRRAFGHYPHQVGSSVRTKDWRDVDVCLMLDDEEFEALGLNGPEGTPSFTMAERWTLLCAALSELGSRMTGLPIDFKIYPRTYANEKHKGRRNPLGMSASHWVPSYESWWEAP